MAQRTYLPTLRLLAKGLCAFIRRYEDQIRERLSEPNEVLLDAALTACAALDAALEPLIPVGS